MPEQRTREASLHPTNRAIVVYLQQHGGQNFEQLHQVFKEPSAYRTDGPDGHKPNPRWLKSRLEQLRTQKHVTWHLKDGAWRYEAAYPAGTPAEPRKGRTPRPVVIPANAVPPRRIYVMGGGNYEPPAPSPRRDGSMDFASCPSVEAGCARPFLPGKAIYG